MKTNLAILALAASIACAPTDAAEISASSLAKCKLHLHGPIEVGDDLIFLSQIQRLDMDYRLVDGPEGNNPETSALCLRSPGGHFFTGQRIAELVHRHGIPTRVLNGDECYSSCAMIFMAGRNLGAEWDGPYRAIEPLAQVGFHAPYTTFGEELTISGTNLNDFVALQNAMVAEIVRFGTYKSIFDYKPAFSPSLLAEMLSTGKDRVFAIKTIEDAERWGILIEDFHVPHQIDSRNVANVCKNFQAWQFDLHANTHLSGHQPTLTHKKLVSENGKTRYFYKVDTGGMAARYCLIAEERTVEGYFQICSHDDFSGVHFGECPDAMFSVPPYYGLPSSTPINALAME